MEKAKVKTYRAVKEERLLISSNLKTGYYFGEVQIQYRRTGSNYPNVTEGSWITQRLTKSSLIVPYLRDHWPVDTISLYETFMVVYLNRMNNIMAHTVISKGGINATVVDTRLVLSSALILGATAIILAHNHPSGSITPSDKDKSLTAEIKKAAEFHIITVCDHVILTEDSYFSFADEGLL